MSERQRARLTSSLASRCRHVNFAVARLRGCTSGARLMPPPGIVPEPGELRLEMSRVYMSLQESTCLVECYLVL